VRAICDADMDWTKRRRAEQYAVVARFLISEAEVGLAAAAQGRERAPGSLLGRVHALGEGGESLFDNGAQNRRFVVEVPVDRWRRDTDLPP